MASFEEVENEIRPERSHTKIDFQTIFEICDLKISRLTQRQRIDNAEEEMAELIVELKHFFREKTTKEEISKEVAHVLITLLYLSDVWDITIVNEEIHNQLLRWQEEYGLNSTPQTQPDEVKTIAIDFDGVIHPGWKGEYAFNSPIKECREYMQQLKEDGWTIVIYTCRSIESLGFVRQYLHRNQIPFDFINENPHQPANIHPSKMFAHLYLDDRGVTFAGSWGDAFKRIQQRPIKGSKE